MTDTTTGTTTGTTMKAIWNSNLDLEDTVVPTPGSDEVLVKVTAAGVNRADVVQREGNYSSPPGVTDIIGMELSGVITELGDNVAQQGRWAPAMTSPRSFPAVATPSRPWSPSAN